jgi:hypothetical protein
MYVLNLMKFLIDQHTAFFRSFTSINSTEIFSKKNAFHDDNRTWHAKVTAGYQPAFFTYGSRKKFFVCKKSSSQRLKFAKNLEPTKQQS